MPNAQMIDVGRHRVTLEARETVTPPTPYTLLLAESIPELSGLTVVDIGTGSGILAIVACLQGASRVYILDTNPAAVEAALQNAELNGVQDRLIHLPIGRSIIPLPSGDGRRSDIKPCPAPPRAPIGETLLGRYRNQMVCQLSEGCVVSDEPKRHGVDCQAHSHSRWMSQPESSAIAALLWANAWSGKPRQKRTIPKNACEFTWGWIRPDRQASCGRSDHAAQAPAPAATEKKQTYRQT